MTDFIPEHFVRGNASADSLDAPEFLGWFVGNFVDFAKRKANPISDAVAQQRFGIRHSRGPEVKWALHSAGQIRPDGWSGLTPGITLGILISGRFEIEHRAASGSVCKETLSKQGDYVMWNGALLSHTWRAIEDSVMLTVRWQSL